MGVGGWRVCGVDERKNNVHEYDANRQCKWRRQRSSGDVMGKERGETIPISWFWVEMEETVLSFRIMSYGV